MRTKGKAVSLYIALALNSAIEGKAVYWIHKNFIALQFNRNQSVSPFTYVCTFFPQFLVLPKQSAVTSSIITVHSDGKTVSKFIKDCFEHKNSFSFV